MSSPSWLDYSDGDKRRMLDVVDLFRERDTWDELGLGSAMPLPMHSSPVPAQS